MTTTNAPAAPAAADTPPAHKRLRPGALGLGGVVFTVLATAAPITAMTGNVPISVASGSGTATPATFIIATAILVIFTIGYSAMARHVTATGAFYGFITRGLGRVAGLASGLVATLAYIVFESSLIGIFASFFKVNVENFGGPHLSWIVYAVLGIAVICALGHFDVELSGRVLGVFLIAEVLILLLMGAAVLLHGGGPDGLMPGTLNPAGGFTAVQGGSVAIGMFFAFWSWIGFETTAVYGEESRNPTRIIPRATLIVVIALGALYTFVSWAAVAGNGAADAAAIAGGSTGNPFDLFLGITRHYAGGWARDVYLVLTVTGSFACALAFHNSAARYLYAIGREGLHRALTPLGTIHGRHRSPYVASLVQSAITLLITLYFYFFQAPTEAAPDVPYYYEFGLLAIMGTMGILIVQAITSVSVVWYFHVRGNHPDTRSWWRTLLAPLTGAAGMGWVVYLLFGNLDFAAGAAADSPVYALTPYLVIGTGVLGVVIAVILRAVDRPAYERIGSTVLAESHERD